MHATQVPFGSLEYTTRKQYFDYERIFWGATQVPFGSFLIVAVLWFVVSLPLVFLGAYFGFRKDVISVPCRTNQIPREIPPQLW